MNGDAAGTVGVRHAEVAALQAIAPRLPAHWVAKTRSDEVLKIHSGDVPENE